MENLKHIKLFLMDMDGTVYVGDKKIASLRVMSVGGGDIEVEGRPVACSPEVYEHNSFAEISAYCRANRIRLSDYVEEREGKEIWEFLYTVWNTMQDAVNEGLVRSGTLPGGLGVERKAQMLYHQRHMDEREDRTARYAGNRAGGGDGYAAMRDVQQIVG